MLQSELEERLKEKLDQIKEKDIRKAKELKAIPLFGSQEYNERGRECALCGTPFVPKRKDAKYCKPQCRVEAHHERNFYSLLDFKLDTLEISKKENYEAASEEEINALVKREAKRLFRKTGRITSGMSDDQLRQLGISDIEALRDMNVHSQIDGDEERFKELVKIVIEESRKTERRAILKWLRKYYKKKHALKKKKKQEEAEQLEQTISVQQK